MSATLREHLLAVGEALTSHAMRTKVMHPLNGIGHAPKVEIGPPATAAEVADLQADLGMPLPESLVQVLREGARDFDIIWSLNAVRRKTEGGRLRSDVQVKVPDAFMSWSHAPAADGTYPAHARRRPDILNGGAGISLDGIRNAVAARPRWQDVYDPKRAYDADERAHFELIQDFMAAGLPVMTSANGDWLAIDLRDGTECMMHVSHEGEEAGIEIDLTLPAFLTHLTLLGPVWPDFTEIFGFSDTVEEVVPGDDRVTRASFDAMGARGQAWRNWFWMGSGLPMPEDALLARCAPPVA